MAKYHELDYIDPLLKEEEIIIRDSVRSFINEKVIPNIGKYFSEGKFPLDLIPIISSLGVFAGNLD
ncbi:MAG: acyl-CoA dehydrogenase, partial [Spirochaetota bacterium]|nr:acyl-CoA dehydrogenase [Spirochaetota bacterium]